ncbi:MAG: GNAT family N-acetyltransferase [Spirochaetota bacterium]
MRHTRFQGAIARDNSILLIRHLSRNTGNRYWVVPGGGIEAGESEIACVEREMREETGLEVRVERLIVDAKEKTGRFYRRQKTFLCTPIGGTEAPGVEPEAEAANFAITDVRWFDLADPPSWFEYITEKDWIVPLLWEIRSAQGYPGSAPASVERLSLLSAHDVHESMPGQSAGSPTTTDRSVIGPTLVRGAREADRPIAWQIVRTAKASLTAAGIPQWSGRYPDPDVLESDLRAGNLHVAEIDGSPAGVASASEEHRHEHSEVRWRCEGTAVFVHRLAVLPEARRRGVASSLLRYIEHRARALRYNAVRLDACTGNAAAIALCESRGYHRVGVVRYADADFFCFERSCRKPPKG